MKPSTRTSRVRRNTDNVRHFTHPLPLLKYGTPLDEADSIPEDAKHAIRTYRPAKATKAVWEHCEEFVRSIAVVLNPHNYDKARLSMTMLGQFVTWLWSTHACELTIETVFTAANIRLYVDTAKKENAYVTRFDTTRFLGTTATRLTGKPTHRMRPPQRNVPKPFTDEQLGALESWANALSTPRRRHNAQALLALCAGAGLTAQEFVRADANDITLTDDTYFITVTDPADGTIRTIPVLREWNRSMKKALTGNATGPIFHGHRGKDVECRGLQGFLTDCTPQKQTRGSASRLRATWLNTQLNRGTPLPLLLELSGLASLASLDAHLQHLPAATLTEHLEVVAGKQVRA